MKTKAAIFILLQSIFISISFSAYACRTADFHHYILLDRIIAEFYKEPIIAKVKIIGIERIFNTQFHYEEIIAKAEVTEAIKGSDVGQIIPIMANPDSCLGGLDENDIGKKGFMAGRMFEGLFVSGRWNNLILKKYNH